MVLSFGRAGWRVISPQSRNQTMHSLLNELALMAILLLVVTLSSRF
jgi:hypothetical protein